jgi:hypothetical protein
LKIQEILNDNSLLTIEKGKLIVKRIGLDKYIKYKPVVD